MQLTTAFKRSWLRRVYRQVPTTYATLTAALNTLNDSAVSDSVSMAGGGSGSITSVSANGRTTTLAAPSEFTLSGQDYAELTGDMLDRYDSARAALVAAGTASPTDAQIYAQMLAELAAAFQSRPNFHGYSQCYS